MSIAQSISPGSAAPRGVNVVDLGYKCLEMFPDLHRRRGDLQTVAATWLLQPAHSHCNEAGACLICRAGAATSRPATPRGQGRGAHEGPRGATHPPRAGPGPSAPPHLRTGPAPLPPPALPARPRARALEMGTFLFKAVTITIESPSTNRWLLFHTNARLCLYVLHLFVANTCHSINRFGHLM